jgi:hypothetical protein
MSDNEGLTKPKKKERSEAQKQAFQKAREARARYLEQQKQKELAGMPDDPKLKKKTYKQVQDELYGRTEQQKKQNFQDLKESEEESIEDDEPSEAESEDISEVFIKPPPKKKPVKEVKPKKKPKEKYPESDSDLQATESEGDQIVIIKKKKKKNTKKKPKQKYIESSEEETEEESEESSEEEKVSRYTKTQQNRKTKSKITVDPVPTRYYFAN